MNTTELTDLPLLISQAKASQFVLEYLSQFDAEDIDSDSVDLRFEVDDVDTGSTVSIVDECGQAAESIRALVEALESAQHESAVNWEAATSLVEENEELKRRIAELEGRAIKFPPKVDRDDSDGYWMLKGQRVSAANAAYYNEALKDVALALFAAGIKCEVKGE